MSLWKKFKKFDDELDEKINISRKFPGYFSKWVFRAMLVPMLFVVFMAGDSVDWSLEPSVYVECEGSIPCRNPLYDVSRAHESPFYAQRTLFPGQTFGEPPSYWVQNGGFLLFLLVLTAFALNHLLYVVRRRW